MGKLDDKLTLYQIIIEPCEEGGYFARCPLLQGCHADGETFGETIDNINDVIKVHLEVRMKKGEIVPLIEIRSPGKMNFQIPIPVNA